MPFQPHLLPVLKVQFSTGQLDSALALEAGSHACVVTTICLSQPLSQHEPFLIQISAHPIGANARAQLLHSLAMSVLSDPVTHAL